MPLYDYVCRRHGEFREWQSMADCDKPASCPVCEKSSPRIVSAPHLGMETTLAKAHSINEKSANEPRVVNRRRGDPMPHDAHRDLTKARADRAHAHHGHAHSHDSGHTQRSKHPWLIRH